MLRDLLRNPLTEWTWWLIRAVQLKVANRRLRIGYLAKARGCRFGRANQLMDRCLVMNCELGDYTYIGADAQIANARIGRFCSIGPWVRCGLGSHPSREYVSTHPAFYALRVRRGYSFADREYYREYRHIMIGHDVWIGAGAILLDGVSIGHGAIVGAGAVVTRDIPPFALAAGVPARVLRFRFSPEDMAFLLEFKWWDRDEAWLRKNYRGMHSIQELRKLYDSPLSASPK